MNEKFINVALEEAKKALKKGEIPIGAVIVKDNKIIAKAHNQKEKKQLITEHAEIIAIRKASKKIGNWRLNDCNIYITLEPCPMCASAIQQARIKNVYYGCNIKDSNNSKIIDKIFFTSNRNSKINSSINLMNSNCKEIIQSFFKEKR